MLIVIILSNLSDMKASLQEIDISLRDSSFLDFWVKDKVFGFHWHYHPQFELCYVKKGFGQRIVGDSNNMFQEGDLVLLGSNLPHCWVTTEAFHQTGKTMEVFVIQFEKEVIHLDLPDFNKVSILFDTASRGIQFYDYDLIAFEKLIDEVTVNNGLKKYAAILKVFDFLENSPCRILASETVASNLPKANDEQRVSKVCDYIHSNFKNTITIDTLADIAAMNPTAFCRFF